MISRRIREQNEIWDSVILADYVLSRLIADFHFYFYFFLYHSPRTYTLIY